MFAGRPSIAHAFNQIRAIERAVPREARRHRFDTGLLTTMLAGLNAISVQTKIARTAVLPASELRALTANVPTGAREVSQFGGAQTDTEAGLLMHQGTDASETGVLQPTHTADRDGVSGFVVERQDDVGEPVDVHSSIMDVQRSRDLEGVPA